MSAVKMTEIACDTNPVPSERAKWVIIGVPWCDQIEDIMLGLLMGENRRLRWLVTLDLSLFLMCDTTKTKRGRALGMALGNDHKRRV